MADEVRKRCGELSTNVNKAGEPCRAYARLGKTTCMSHADEAEKAEVGFGGAENGRKGGESGRVPRLTEVLSQRIEEEVDKIMDRLLAGLDAEVGIVVGTGKDAFLDSFPDYAMRLRTVKEIFDRIEGRPKTLSEFKGTVEHRNAEQLDKAIGRELQRLTEKLAEKDGERSERPDPARG